jgi:putative ABC transport system permease protein
MKQLIKIAIRNITRNRKRTLLTVITIVVGVYATLMAKGMLTAVKSAIVTTLTGSVYGDFQVHAAGYVKALEALPLNMVIREKSEIERILQDLPGELKFTRRIHFGGLVYPDEERSSIFKGIAVDPQRELAVCPGVTDFLVEGRFLSTDDKYEAIISKTLAENFNLRLNSMVTLAGQDKNDLLNITEVKVVGIMDINFPGFDKKFIYTNIKAIQEFLDMDGEYTEIAASSDELAKSKIAYENLKAQLNKKNLGFEVHFWDEIGKFFRTIIDFQSLISNIIAVIFIVMVSTAIVNTMIMAVFERVNEIGMMRALGMKKKKVIKLFLMEAFSLVAIGGLIGLSLATTVINILNIIGIRFKPPGSSFFITLHPGITWQTALLIYLFVIAAGTIASLYPAVTASKLKPAKALRAE